MFLRINRYNIPLLFVIQLITQFRTSWDVYLKLKIVLFYLIFKPVNKTNGKQNRLLAVTLLSLYIILIVFPSGSKGDFKLFPNKVRSTTTARPLH